MNLILIDPHFMTAHPVSYPPRWGDTPTLKDALESFWSSVWQQGHDPDGRIMETYGDWTVYLRDEDGTLKPQGLLKDLMDSNGRAKVDLSENSFPVSLPSAVDKG